MSKVNVLARWRRAISAARGWRHDPGVGGADDGVRYAGVEGGPGEGKVVAVCVVRDIVGCVDCPISELEI